MTNPRYSRARRRQGEDGGDEGGPPPARKKGNEALIIGLVLGAVVLAVVFYFFASGGGMSEAEVVDARSFLREVFKMCLENRETEGAEIVQPREVLRDENKNDIERWASLPPERIRALKTMAFHTIRMRVINKPYLELSDMNQVDTILAAATHKTFAAQRRVDFQWNWAGAMYNATVSKFEGRWLIHRLDKTAK